MKPALFLHIQKAAGTSVQDMAREAYGNDQVISHGEFLTLGIEGCRHYSFVSGHFGYAFAKPLMEGRYCFTFLRDPIERLLSLYEFCLTRDPKEHPIYAIAQKTGLDGFFSDSHGPDHFSAIWNHQVWQMTYGWGEMLAGGAGTDPLLVNSDELLQKAKINLATFDHVGFVSNFDADIAVVFRAIGARKFLRRWSNASVRRGSTLSSSVRSQMEKISELDHELYDYAIQTYHVHSSRRGSIRAATSLLAQPFQRLVGTAKAKND